MAVTPRVLDLAGRTRSGSVEVIASPVTELLMGLQAFQFEDAASTFDAGPGWFDHIRMLLPPDMAVALALDAPVGWGSLLGMALAEGAATDVDAFLDRLDAMDPVDVWVMLAGGHVRPLTDHVDPDTFRQAAGGDQGARSRLTRAATHLYGEDEAKVGLLRREPGEVKSRLLAALRGWDRSILAPDASRTMDVLTRDADAKLRLRRTTSDEKLIEVASNGLVWEPEPWVRRVILTPHLAMRPWNVVCAYEDAYVLCYPAADETLGIDRAAPPTQLLRLHKALSDERRLRILRLLAERDMSLPELSDALGLAKSTTHHHTVVLRAAGLIRTSTSVENRYSLRRDTVGEAGPALARFLDGGTP
jgi:DNA-binding transcriptional ArsR family regulator